ncbi:MAG: DUF2099 family protein [Methanobacteriaceae archaeon]|jgi:putative methanogenesis marker protein 8|nr:DUF2099 family protein [Candidatus Methanorudis spinitermitis]
MDEHVVEAMGKAKVIIKDRKVIEVEDPKIEYCPLFHKHRGIEKIDKESIKKNMEFRIEDFGMCSPSREVFMKDFLSFGVSEILSTLLADNLIDCAIMVCEGCGTVIVTESEMAQGVGGRVSGLVKTSPIPEIMEKIGKKNILDPETVGINQVKGIELAIEQGFKNIAVTITNTKELKIIRGIEKNNKDLAIYIFAVHTTGLDEEESKKLFDYCDIITGCASKPVRNLGDEIANMKVGESIPIYAATKKGEEFLKLRIEKIGGLKPKKDPKIPKPLI